MQDGQRRSETAALADAESRRTDILGPAVPLRAREEPAPTIAADLSNVIPFARRRKTADRSPDSRDAPAISLDPATRPAPWLGPTGRDRIGLFLLCSIAAHSALYAFFNREPQPLASIGIESITVEIVLGANTPAGLAKTPSQSEITSAAAPEEPKPQATVPERARQQQADRPRVEPEVKVAAADIVKPDAKPAERPMASPAEVRPAQADEIAKAEPAKSERATAQPLSATPTLLPQQAEIVVTAEPVDVIEPKLIETPVDKPTEVTVAARPVETAPLKPLETAVDSKPVEIPLVKQPDRPADTTTEVKPAEMPQPSEPEKAELAKETPKKPPEVKRTRENARDQRDRAAPASTPSVASNSVGRGRSDADTNYRGIVAAHLARFKQFPADARSRGDQGTAVVTFAIDGGGRVTSVRLTRGSGVSSLDHESQAMVRRASPFPAPPTRSAMSFTVPVDFALR